MSKNLVVVFFLVVIIGAGFGYVILSDPELNEQRLFDSAIAQFAKSAEPLEKQYFASQPLAATTQQFQLDFKDQQNKPSTIPLTLSVANSLVTLSFGDGDSLQANQTIMLEPFVKDQKIRWKCLDGSVLIRLRSKECRLGQGISTAKILSE